MPWICRQDGNGFSSECLTDDEWDRLESILSAHDAPIVDEDDSGVRIDRFNPSYPDCPEKIAALTKTLHQSGFAWVNGDYYESN